MADLFLYLVNGFEFEPYVLSIILLVIVVIFYILYSFFKKDKNNKKIRNSLYIIIASSYSMTLSQVLSFNADSNTFTFYFVNLLLYVALVTLGVFTYGKILEEIKNKKDKKIIINIY